MMLYKKLLYWANFAPSSSAILQSWMRTVSAFWMVGSSVSLSFWRQSMIIFSGSASSSIDLNSSSLGIRSCNVLSNACSSQSFLKGNLIVRSPSRKLNKEFAFLPVVPCGTTIFTNLPEVENRKGIYRCTCMCCAWSCILYIKLNLCVCLCVCVCVCVSVCARYRNPHRWTNPHQIWYGGLTLQGPGHKLCFGPRGGPQVCGVVGWARRPLRRRLPCTGLLLIPGNAGYFC